MNLIPLPAFASFPDRDAPPGHPDRLVRPQGDVTVQKAAYRALRRMRSILVTGPHADRRAGDGAPREWTNGVR
jgi:hypothetical protein